MGARKRGSRTTVHPHVRGEYGKRSGAVVSSHGSSPRAWGIRRTPVHVFPSWRFIPTCVGNTSCRWMWTLWTAVHPHVRGEYCGNLMVRDSAPGSSPRAWGIRYRAPASWPFPRFIPTCVGNTFTQSGPPLWRPVHPHVRGEYLYTIGAASMAAGSSPRAWGILLLSASCEPCPRFIPTCVGNTP